MSEEYPDPDDNPNLHKVDIRYLGDDGEIISRGEFARLTRSHHCARCKENLFEEEGVTIVYQVGIMHDSCAAIHASEILARN